MFRGNLALEILGLCMVLASGICTVVFLPAPIVVLVPMGFFCSYVVLETLLPTVYEEPDDD